MTDTKSNGAAHDDSAATDASAEGARDDARSDGPDASGGAELDPAVAARIASVRSKLRESFGSVVMSMLMLSRYRHQTIADLQHLVLEPLIRNRVVIAYPAASDNALSDLTGIAMWASVSKAVDAKIREQIKAGTFPLRLAADDWTSGTPDDTVNWLLDVIAPDRKGVRALIANFNKVIDQGPLVLHPIVARQVDREDLERLGATRAPSTEAATDEPNPS